MAVLAAFQDPMRFQEASPRYDKVLADVLRCYSRTFWEVPGNQYLSPYMTVFQSSMIGKSCLLKELAQDAFFTVFICLRSQSTKMQPPRTTGVADTLAKPNPKSSQALMGLLVRAYSNEFTLWVQNTRVRSPSQLNPGNWSKYQKDVVDARVDSVLNEAASRTDFYLQPQDFSVVADELEPCKSLELLFVFDEARELLKVEDTGGMNLFRYGFPFSNYLFELLQHKRLQMNTRFDHCMCAGAYVDALQI